MRGALIAVLAVATGCGFSAGGGQGIPNDDAGTIIDAPPGGDGNTGDATGDSRADAPVGAQCPITYAPIVSPTTLSSRYRFVGGGGVKWIDAENDCAGDSGGGELPTHLVVLDDAVEAIAVIGGIAGGGNIQDQWIGATDLQDEDTIEYVTDQVATLTLAPTAQNANKDCIRLKNSQATEFRSCDEMNKYVCECDGRPADPTRFPNPPDGNGNN